MFVAKKCDRMISMTKTYSFCGILFLLLACFGCARDAHDSEGIGNTGQEDAMDLLLDDDFLDDESLPEIEYYDPLEPMNRVFFEFNDKLYYWVFDPLNSVYTATLPFDIRYSIGNFVYNLAAPIRFLNNVLQLKFNDAGAVLSRFVINSTLGVYGFRFYCAKHYLLFFSF